jgi:hypothetical protein
VQWGQASGLPLPERLEQQCGCGDRHVQRLHHASHRDENRLIHERSGFLGQPPFLRTQNEGAGAGEVTVAIVACIHAQVGAVKPKTMILEMAHCTADVGMVMQWHPALASLGGAVEGAGPAAEADCMGFQNPHGVAAAQNRREVVGFFHMLHQHGQIRHAAVQNLFQALKSAGKDRHR